MPERIVIERLRPADIDVIAPLWKALLDHIAVLPGSLVPVRPSDESWEMECRIMREALEGDAFVLVARRGAAAVGYIFVIIEGPDPVWYTGDGHAELAHLSVAAAERGRGVGTALMDAMDVELAKRGIEDVEIGVDTGNDVAANLYESRGYRPDFRIFYGTPGKKPWACLRREDADRRAGCGRFASPIDLPGPHTTGDDRARPPRKREAAADGIAADAAAARRYVSVIGASRATPEQAAKAEELGELLADAGCVVVCGGREGVMEAVARGVKRRGGVTIGILPEADRRRAALGVTYSICSAMGYARNLSVAASGDVVIALGGAWGTLSEIALARNVGKPVILLDTWSVTPPDGGELDEVRRADTPAEAVELALRLIT